MQMMSITPTSSIYRYFTHSAKNGLSIVHSPSMAYTRPSSTSLDMARLTEAVLLTPEKFRKSPEYIPFPPRLAIAVRICTCRAVSCFMAKEKCSPSRAKMTAKALRISTLDLSFVLCGFALCSFGLCCFAQRENDTIIHIWLSTHAATQNHTPGRYRTCHLHLSDSTTQKTGFAPHASHGGGRFTRSKANRTIQTNHSRTITTRSQKTRFGLPTSSG